MWKIGDGTTSKMYLLVKNDSYLRPSNKTTRKLYDVLKYRYIKIMIIQFLNLYHFF